VFIWLYGDAVLWRDATVDSAADERSRDVNSHSDNNDDDNNYAVHHKRRQLKPLIHLS